MFTEAPGKHARETPRRATPKEGRWGAAQGLDSLELLAFSYCVWPWRIKISACISKQSEGRWSLIRSLNERRSGVFWQVLDETGSPKLCRDWGVLAEPVTAPASSFSAVSHMPFKISDIPNYLHLSGPPASPCSFCPIRLEPESPRSASYLAWGPMCAPFILIALLPPNPNLLAVSRQQIIPLAHQELTAEWAT